MKFQYLKVEDKEPVITLYLNNAPKHNALNATMIQELGDFFDGVASKNPQAKIIILRAEGKSFCAGADLEYMRSMANFSHAENVQDAQALSHVFEAILNCPLPVVGFTHGAVYGGGIGLLAACDIILAEASAKFCFSEVKLGLAPAVISPIATARIGFHQARRYFLTGEVFSAEQALSVNLVHEVTSLENVEQRLQYFTETLLAGGQYAQGKIKTMLNSLYALYDSGSSGIKELQELIAHLRISEDAQQRMKKFLNK